MSIEAYNQREQYFSEYFNLKKKKKELISDRQVIKLPQKKQHFQKIREYLKGECADIEAIASHLAGDNQNGVKNNFGHQVKYCQMALDGAENSMSEANQEDAATEADQGAEPEEKAEVAKEQAKAAATRRIMARATAQTTIRYAGALASSVVVILAAIILFLILILTIVMWLFGSM